MSASAATETNPMGISKTETAKGSDGSTLLLMAIPVLLLIAALALLVFYFLRKKLPNNPMDAPKTKAVKTQAGKNGVVTLLPPPMKQAPKKTYAKEPVQVQPFPEAAAGSTEAQAKPDEPLAPLKEEYARIGAEIGRMRSERKNTLSTYHEFRITTKTAIKKLREQGDELAPLLAQAHQLSVLLGAEFDEAREAKADVAEWVGEKLTLGEYSEILKKDLTDVGMDAGIVDDVVASRKTQIVPEPEKPKEESSAPQKEQAPAEKKARDEPPIQKKPPENPSEGEEFDPAL